MVRLWPKYFEYIFREAAGVYLDTGNRMVLQSTDEVMDRTIETV